MTLKNRISNRTKVHEYGNSIPILTFIIMPYVIIWKDFFQGAIVCEILQTLVVSSQPYKTKSPKVKFTEFKMPKVSTNRKH